MITLTKSDIIYENHYNKDSKDYVRKIVDNLVSFLNHKVELSDDFTLGDFFKFIEREKEIMNVVFSSHLGHYSLDDFLEEVNKEAIEVEHPMDYVYVGWHTASDSDGEICFSPDFSGWGDGTGPNSDEISKINYSLSFSPLNEIKQYLLKLKKEVKFYNEVDVDKYDEVIFEGYREFTVYELIEGVLDDLSFYGDPATRNDFLEETVEIAKKIEENDSKFMSLDEFKKELNLKEDNDEKRIKFKRR